MWKDDKDLPFHHFASVFVLHRFTAVAGLLRGSELMDLRFVITEMVPKLTAQSPASARYRLCFHQSGMGIKNGKVS